MILGGGGAAVLLLVPLALLAVGWFRVIVAAGRRGAQVGEQTRLESEIVQERLVPIDFSRVSELSTATPISAPKHSTAPAADSRCGGSAEAR